MIVADNETAVDLLYYEAIARTVVRLVVEKSDDSLNVGVHGDWGAGKSSVLMMVGEASLMGTSGAFGGSKSGVVPNWVDEPASSQFGAGPHSM